jgi:hypothetical protein
VVKKKISFGPWGELEMGGEATPLAPPSQAKLDEALLVASTGGVKSTKSSDIVPMVGKLKPEEARVALIHWATANNKNKDVASKSSVKKVEARTGLQVCTGEKLKFYFLFVVLIDALIFKYKLETFCEKRSVKCAYKPYKTGEAYDSLVKGPVSDPWKLQVKPASNFVEETIVHDLPTTDVIEV